jgi:hypothetical protein
MLITHLLETAHPDAMQAEPSCWPLDIRESCQEVAQIPPALIEEEPIVFERDYGRGFIWS